ncbi:MAG: 1,4-alpha-glucan branching protein domain-containing protein [Promethearchaeota archaeon]
MSFALTLHAHIPWCRKSGRWPAGEEWLHEAIIECYLPIARIIEELADSGIKPNLNMDFTPILLEQLADPYMQDQFVMYLEDLIRRAEADIRRFKSRPELKKIAEYYLNDFNFYLDYYKNKLKKDIIGKYKKFQDDGFIELFTSAATHGFLPLLGQDSSIQAQVMIGVETYYKYFDRQPAGFWLPECAYRPQIVENGEQRRGIEYWLEKAGVKYFIVNYTGIDQASLKLINPDGVGYTSTYEGYRVSGTNICVFGRNYATSEKVWSGVVGYPANKLYREFHVKDQVSGLRYLAISDRRRDGPKVNYDLELAMNQVEKDANDFVGLIEQCLNDYKNINKHEGIIVAPYDFELFGHWWWEGPIWVKKIFEKLSKNENIMPVKLSEYVKEHESKFSEIELPATSWGEGGDFRVWNNPQHAWIWPLINSSARDFESLLEKIQEPPYEPVKRILYQMARELLLMEGSDWPFLLYTAQAKEYANQRFHWHHQRFNTLLWPAKNYKDDEKIKNVMGFLQEVENIDNCFQKLNLGWFKRCNQ